MVDLFNENQRDRRSVVVFVFQPKKQEKKKQSQSGFPFSILESGFEWLTLSIEKAAYTFTDYVIVPFLKRLKRMLLR
jgi:hypothetical protein